MGIFDFAVLAIFWIGFCGFCASQLKYRKYLLGVHASINNWFGFDSFACGFRF